jgi:enamine deaminase RidA (YjgF/YER057c/UK114 family)
MSDSHLDRSSRMSQVVLHRGTAHFAGMVADDASGPADDQTRQILEKIDRYLERLGAQRGDVLSAVIWLKDMADYAAVNSVWDAWIDAQRPPARACVKADLVKPDWRVELMITAAYPEAPR